jgi:L-threonylcarbamoyladenylate synthase
MPIFSSILISDAAAAISRGEIVAFPTETYYGLAANALDPAALERLFALKGRSAEKSSALLVADMAMFSGLCTEVPGQAFDLAKAHWPGPLTIALPARSDLPAPIVTDGCVAARVSSHPIAHALVLAVGRPITATSANAAGALPARSIAEVLSHFAGKAIHLLNGGQTAGGLPSTLVRLRAGGLEILRQGAVSL